LTWLAGWLAPYVFFFPLMLDLLSYALYFSNVHAFISTISLFVQILFIFQVGFRNQRISRGSSPSFLRYIFGPAFFLRFVPTFALWFSQSLDFPDSVCGLPPTNTVVVVCMYIVSIAPSF